MSDSCGPDAGASYMVTADSTSTVQKSPPHGPDARASNMEIACSSLAVRALLHHGPDARGLLWKLLTADVRQSGRSSHPVRTMFLYRKDFSAKILENPLAQLSVWTVPRHIFPDAHSDPQPINRAPRHLELQEFGVNSIKAQRRDISSKAVFQVCYAVNRSLS